jgi:hypothetical protein
MLPIGNYYFLLGKDKAVRYSLKTDAIAAYREQNIASHIQSVNRSIEEYEESNQ